MSVATLVSKDLWAGGRLGRFVLRPAGRRWDFQPGQFTSVGLDTPHGFVVRAYSIANAPEQDDLEFHIALVPDGRLTPSLFALAPGAEIRYLNPKGHFTLAKAAQPIVLQVATGTGLAPFLSQLRSRWNAYQGGQRDGRRIVLFHGAAFADELSYADELRRYADDHDFGLTYIATVSRPDPRQGVPAGIGRGRVNHLVRQVLGQGGAGSLPPQVTLDTLRHDLAPERTAVLACGNPGMIADLRQAVADAGITTFLSEEFWKG